MNELTTLRASGRTIVAKLMSGAAQVGANVPMTESATPGYYTGSVPSGTPAGAYTVLMVDGGVPYGAGDLRWDGAAEIRAAAPSDVPSATALTAAVWAASDRTLTSFGSGGATPEAAAVAAAVLASTVGDGTVEDALSKLNFVPPDSPAMVVPGPPADTSQCALYGYFKDIANRIPTGLRISVSLVLPSAAQVASAGRLLKRGEVSLTTDHSGALVMADGSPVTLARNDMIEPAGTSYKFDCRDIGVVGRLITLNTPTADLRQLLMPA